MSPISVSSLKFLASAVPTIFGGLKIPKVGHAGANIPCLQARTCLTIRISCLKVRKSVL